MKNKLPRVNNSWSAPITSFGFGFQSERSWKYVSSLLNLRIDNPQFSRSENKSSGQTLIEIIIAIAVGTLIVSAALGLITRANKNANFAKTQSQANKLANEGMEIILNIRAVNDCEAVIPYGAFSGGCGSSSNTSWDELYTIQIDNSCAVAAECSDDYGHIFRLHSPESPECASAVSWCIHGHVDLSPEKEEITLDNVTFIREVFIADSPPPPSGFQGHSQCNDSLVMDDFENIKQITVKVSWVDSAGIHDSKLVSCIASL